MAEVTEGQLQAVLYTPEMEAREEAVNEYGAALIQAQEVFEESTAEIDQGAAEEIDASSNRPARRSSGKRRSTNGRRGRKAQSGGQEQPEA
jgi:hypothetical protein